MHLDDSGGDRAEDLQSSCMWTKRTGATRGWIAQHQTPAAEEQTGDGPVTAAEQTQRPSGTHIYSIAHTLLLY